MPFSVFLSTLEQTIEIRFLPFNFPLFLIFRDGVDAALGYFWIGGGCWVVVEGTVV
jgi:hypothetical protein